MNIKQNTDLQMLNVGIIMDGNRRWSSNKGLPIAVGYKKGVQTLKTIINYSSKININSLTVFAFSVENWQRMPSEVRLINNLLKWYLISEIADLHLHNIKFCVIGDKKHFSKKIQELLSTSEELTK